MGKERKKARGGHLNAFPPCFYIICRAPKQQAKKKKKKKSIQTLFLFKVHVFKIK